MLKDYRSLLLYLLKWGIIATCIGSLSGLASAFFLKSLSWAGDFRSDHLWLIWLLPIAGFFVGALYYYFGKSVEGGNNQLLEEIHNPQKIVPLKMAPLVLLGTVVSHFFGASVGREGTAVQMGGSIADQFSRFKFINKDDRRIIIIIGIAAGFSSVFGTPLAGAIFGLEVYLLGKMNYKAIFPSFVGAITANYIGEISLHAMHGKHTTYLIPEVAEMNLLNLGLAVAAGLLFGITARCFSGAALHFGNYFNKYIKYPPAKPLIGGLIIAVLFTLLGTDRYMGLGVPVIEEAFVQHVEYHDFILKLLFTTFCLGAGYKGGEVTPLFFVGATLGNVLSLFIPLPMALLAGMGFVAVFSGAANTPIATIFMGIELFGHEAGVFIAIACVVSYLSSGHSGIYKKQKIGSSKQPSFIHEEGEILQNIKRRK